LTGNKNRIAKGKTPKFSVKMEFLTLRLKCCILAGNVAGLDVESGLCIDESDG